MNSEKKKRASVEILKDVIVHRTLKMIIIEESENDDLDTLISYMHRTPKERVVAITAAAAILHQNMQKEDGQKKEDENGSSILQYHLPVNFPTSHRPTLLPDPGGFTRDGTPFYYPPDEVDSTTLPVGYTSLGHPMYVPEGSWLPSPVGYTDHGIPYYSAYEISKSR